MTPRLGFADIVFAVLTYPANVQLGLQVVEAWAAAAAETLVVYLFTEKMTRGPHPSGRFGRVIEVDSYIDLLATSPGCSRLASGAPSHQLRGQPNRVPTRRSAPTQPTVAAKHFAMALWLADNEQREWSPPPQFEL